jgi:hypothetical protein
MEKARMTGSSEAGWTTEMGQKFNSSLIVTTNFDIGTIIGSGRSSDAQMLSDAGRSRLLEVSATAIKVPHDVTPADWRKHEGQVLDNYGHALDVFARYVSTRQRTISDELRDVEAQVHGGLMNKAPIAARGVLRFWAKYLACVYVAGRVLTVHQPILPWNMSAILKAGMGLVIESDEEASVDKENVVEAMWDMFLDDKDGRHSINFSYHRAVFGASWPAWDSDAEVQRGRVRRWDDEAVGSQLIRGQAVPGATLVRLHTAFQWRVMLTRIVDATDNVLRFERDVIISMPELENLISYHSGRGLKVVDWVEAHDAFKINGAVVGVKPGRPKMQCLGSRGDDATV